METKETITTGTTGTIGIQIKQILPDIFFNEAPLKEAVCLKVEKKKTGLIIDFIKRSLDGGVNSVISDKAYLKSQSDKMSSDPSNLYKTGKYNKQLLYSNTSKEYKEYDISFLKRVKPLNANENVVLIAFKEHLDFLSNSDTATNILTQLKLFLQEKSIEEDLVELQLPFVQPLTEEQYNFSKKFWPLSNLPTSLSQIVYKHGKEEAEEIERIVSLMKQLKIGSVLYDPINKKIIEKADENPTHLIKKFNPNPITSDHLIMRLINDYSIKLVRLGNSKKESENETTTILDEKKLLGHKQEQSPFIDYLDTLGEFDYLNPVSQYYCENFYVLSNEEPCFMCAMALVHSRIDRIYFLSDNLKDGALHSKLKINNYNLNHSYLIFKII